MSPWRTWLESGSSNDRPRPETTPELIEPYSPNGLPTTNASLPTWAEAGLPSVAGTRTAGSSSARRTAMSSSGRRTWIRAADFEPSAKVSSMLVASATTWRLVRMSPSWLTTTPLPMASPAPSLTAVFFVWMKTSDGWMTW